MRLKFFHDAGHGWLEVPLPMLETSGYQPTRFSYRTDTHAYLEEDCDAPRFEQLVGGIESDSIYHRGESPIRNYRRFKETSK